MAVSIRVRGPAVNIRHGNMRTRVHMPHLDPQRGSAPIPAMPSAVIFQGNALRHHPNSLTRVSFPNR